MRRLARPCLECGKPTRFGPRCEAHAYLNPAKGRPKASRQDRGYGAEHQRARRELARILEVRGVVRCAYCPGLIRPGDKWVAAHVVDGDPSHGWWLAHPLCNERAKPRRRRRKRGA